MSTKNIQVTVYEPNYSRTTFLASLIAILKDIKPAHELGFRLFKRDLKSQYRQSFLGFIWVLVPPLLTAGLWIFLNKNRVVNVGETDIPYPLFVMIGTILWQVFAEGVNQPLASVRSNQSMLTKINFPREALLLSGFYTIIFNLAPKLLVLASAYAFFKLQPSISLAYFPIGLLMISLTGFMIGLLLTPIGLLINDVSRGLTILLPFLMYLTPVIYPTPTSGQVAILTKFNPLATLITSTRDWLSGQLIYIPQEFSILSGLTILLLFIGMLAYRISMPIITERFGG
ncbi:ABC transporter permease [Methylomarinum vadi]|uniref:ABC transporter permease n=1 Tax=Methylomarinum vadi TaxID=438855 RepID=UPI0004DF399E|nr:ABC transporter permease [Methylomarinum vadi]